MSIAGLSTGAPLFNYFTLTCAFGYAPVTFPVHDGPSGSRGCACILPVFAARASAFEDLHVCESVGSRTATCVYTGPIRTTSGVNHYPEPRDGTTAPHLTTGRRLLVESIVNQVLKRELLTAPVPSSSLSSAVCGTLASYRTPCPPGQVRITDSASFTANQASRKPKDKNVAYACAPPFGPKCSTAEGGSGGKKTGMGGKCASTLLHTATCGPKGVLPDKQGLFSYACEEATPKTHHSTQTEYCPATETACPSSSDPLESGYECLDPRRELQSCGGCATLGEGEDCTSIPGAMGVGCQDGRCVVFSCEPGFRLRAGRCRRTSRPRSRRP